MRPQFFSVESFQESGRYTVLPFRSIQIPSLEKILITSDAGEYVFLGKDEFEDFVDRRLPPNSSQYLDLAAKQMLSVGSTDTAVRVLAAKVRTKKSFLRHGPSLHLFVVTLRCDHSCHYCQVSRVSVDRSRFDMSPETAKAAVDRMFESNSPSLTVEFQGGEPLLAFPTIERIVDAVSARNASEKRRITFTITSTLHHLDDAMLRFFREHNFEVSTSLDGPASIHNANRPNPNFDSHTRTIDGIQFARSVLGHDKVSALTTLTRRSLDQPEAIIDEYVRLGFRTIFLRPLNPYGFAIKSERKTGYPMAAFLPFYERALAYILSLNTSGVKLEEAYAATILSHILTPFPSRYVDLRSPTGAGFSTIAYNYDGSVYPSDEARMLAAMGDETFRLGTVHQPFDELMKSEAMNILREAGVAEVLPGCRDCAFVPYCGADPVHMHATLGSAFAPPPSSAHCARHMGLFQIFFRYLAQPTPEIMKTFLSWVTQRDSALGARA